MAASLADQCKFHLMPTGCKWPDTCQLGRHDPEFRGRGTGKGDTTKGAKGKGKGKGDKGKKKGEDVPPPPKPAAPAKLPDEALVDANGRRPCYKFIHGTCNDPNCKRDHGPETKAMQAKRLKDEAKMQQQRDAGGDGTQSDIEADDDAKPKAKAKAKAKA